MLTFGASTVTDLLSWIIALTMGAKLAATIVLLLVDKSARDRPGWGTILWRTTKLTPVVAVPCLTLLAWVQRDQQLLWISAGLALFVAIAVPLKIRERAARIAGAAPLAVSR